MTAERQPTTSMELPKGTRLVLRATYVITKATPDTFELTVGPDAVVELHEPQEAPE